MVIVYALTGKRLVVGRNEVCSHSKYQTRKESHRIKYPKVVVRSAHTLQLKLISGLFSLSGPFSREKKLNIRLSGMKKGDRIKGNETQNESKNKYIFPHLSLSTVQHFKWGFKHKFWKRKCHLFFYISGIIAIVLDCNEYLDDVETERIESAKRWTVVSLQRQPHCVCVNLSLKKTSYKWNKVK